MVVESIPSAVSSVEAVLSTMNATAAQLAEASSTALNSPVGDGSDASLILAGLAAFLRSLPTSVFYLVTFVFITLPTWMFAVFSATLTLSLNATTVLLIFLVFASTISGFIRYRYLNMYSQQPLEPQRKESQLDLFPDTQEGEHTKPGLASYLDEFLSAIKVFGYLERPVFHELTRTMQTRKLIAGETLLLEEEKGFCIVVDGQVQIFVKSNREEESGHMSSERSRGHSHEDEDRRRGRQGYQLLTEVKNGASMSSLFSVLSLFTEDIKLRHDEAEPESRRAESPRAFGFPPMPRPTSADGSPTNAERGSDQDPSEMHRLSLVPPMTLDSEHSPGPTQMDQHDSRSSLPTGGAIHESLLRSSHHEKSAHPNIVARARVDTTIAIIPASAFRRLTRVYPKATSHIVQVILSRLQRVTLATAHSYLGLTDDVLMIEKNMNKYTAYDLPNHLRGSALERLKTKFRQEKERQTSSEDEMKGIALHNPNAGRRPQSRGSTVRKDLLAKVQLAQLQASKGGIPNESAIVTEPRSYVSPGDLLANIQVSRASGHTPSFSLGKIETPSAPVEAKEVRSPLAVRERTPFMPSPRLGMQRQESVDEDDLFRESIMSCMGKAIGLSNVKPVANRPESVEQSPRLLSFDRRNQTATFSNAFGYMDPYDGTTEADSESVASASGVSLGGGFFSLDALNQELRDDLEIVYFPKGAVLVEQGERNPGLYYVLDGFLDVSYQVEEKSVLPTASPEATATSPLLFENELLDKDTRPVGHRQRSSQKISSKLKTKSTHRKTVFLIKPGGLAGYIGTVSSHRSFVDIRAKTDVYVGFLPRASLERFVEKHPVVLLTMAKRLTSLLPKLMLHIDFALEWVQINAGEVIHHQGDESDAIYIVLNGRLRSVMETSQGEMRAVGEYGQGESVGELEVMTESRRPATLHAIRDTEVAKFPKTLFNSLALEHPGITMKISKIIAQRMRSLVEDPMLELGMDRTSPLIDKNVKSSMNLRTIAVLPVTAGVPVVDFGNRLLSALTQIGVPNRVTSLNHAAIMNHLGRHAFSKMGKLKLSQYLADLEERYGMLLYIADTNVNSPWTQTCITQADCILLIGLAESSPAIGEYEKFLLGMKTTSRKELVLLHTERYSPPGLTRKWLRNRVWITGGHHHIQMAFQTQPGPANPQGRRFGAAIKQRVQVLQAEIQKYTSRRIRQMPLYTSDTPFKGDFHRLARNLCGRSVGLVLGGGGARGIAQVGIIRALEEAGIPIDIVGGTSIGSFMGALYAREANVVPMYGRAKGFCGRMGSIWRFALDLTYPSISYTTGHEFNRGIFKTFGDSQIEDFWLPYYCNTTNITKSRSEIHNSGYVWRYVRASMSLAGLLPPLCDEGSMLLDGGYVDNLTVSHMKTLGADVVFAVDVGASDDDTPQAYGEALSGAWALINRWNPFSNYPNPPTLSEIQARLAYVSSVDALERAKKVPGCVYMRPPIDPYGTLDFAKFDEIYDVGYKYGTEFLAKMRQKGLLPNTEETEEKKKMRRTLAPRRASI